VNWPRKQPKSVLRTQTRAQATTRLADPTSRAPLNQNNRLSRVTCFRGLRRKLERRKKTSSDFPPSLMLLLGSVQVRVQWGLDGPRGRGLAARDYVPQWRNRYELKKTTSLSRFALNAWRVLLTTVVACHVIRLALLPDDDLLLFLNRLSFHVRPTKSFLWDLRVVPACYVVEVLWGA